MNIPEPEEVSLNLIPIMNLFTALIPFLLLSAAFFHLAIVKISVPVADTEGTGTNIERDLDRITLNLNIMEDAYEMSGSNEALTPKELPKPRKVPRQKAASEEELKAIMKQVSQAAYEIKGKFAKSDTVIVVADADVPYEEVIYAVDSVREISVERGGIKSRVSLFPKVVLSSVVK